ncbi:MULTISPECIES: helix-turn-helix domain-containing protein [Streptomyces]|uniref:helix-turn-helix domain-containing protein n=1 Tax=Streptomyces TaxID=1883 RepID=UPI0029B608F5|nr:helix-turn-helix transcriptional regulator [Streptomyces sp. ME02-6978.2a]MDX3360590.1 helix-turn-helix transcriptional regulator [Streptomyces sp. ME02-6978.2a]
MRSKDSPERTGPAALGALITELAARVRPEPYDLRPGGTGRKRLAEDVGMSIWAVGRMLRGETLPRVENVYALARVLGADEEQLLDTAGYRQGANRTKRPKEPVLSIANPLTPEAIADGLGITHPFVRKMLISSITEAMRLQREADQHHGGDPGETAVAR